MKSRQHAVTILSSLTLAVVVSLAPAATLWADPTTAAAPPPPSIADMQAAYGHLPLSFEANQGQTDPQVQFLTRGNGYSLSLTGNEAVLALKKKSGVMSPQSARPPFRVADQGRADLSFKSAASAALPAFLRPPGAEVNDDLVSFAATDHRLQTTDAAVRMRMVGADPHATVAGLEELPGKSNYFIGNDPKKWRTNLPNYAKVKYANVYPGVDLVYYGNQGQLEYDFVVQPDADPQQIELQITASASSPPHAAETEKLFIDSNGDLVVPIDSGEVRFHRPVVYQFEASAGDRHLIDGQYVLRGGDRIAFQLGQYDRGLPLVIDPTLAYSTYLGGSDTDLQGGAGIAVDASGNAYVTGSTFSSDFPTTPGAFQTTFGGTHNAFVSKLNAAGSALLYSTYLGGHNTFGTFGNCCFAIAADASGNALRAGNRGNLIGVLARVVWR